MSKEGLPDIAQVDGSGLRVAVVTATWNAEICDQLHAQAVQTATDNGAEVAEYRVVGALELGVVVQAAARSYDAVVALGFGRKQGRRGYDCGFRYRAAVAYTKRSTEVTSSNASARDA